MSSITVIHKTETPNNRNSIFIALTALVTLLAAMAMASVNSSSAQPFDYNAYMLHRKGEWVSPAVSPAQAYQIFRLGEWAAVETVDLSVYQQSERTLVDPNAGLAIYQRSERTLVDPQAGLAIYQASERTRIPVRFNQYQRSEWFGE